MTADEPTNPPTSEATALTGATNPAAEEEPWPTDESLAMLVRAARSNPRFLDYFHTQSAADLMLADGTPMPAPVWADIRMPVLWSSPEKPSTAGSRA